MQDTPSRSGPMALTPAQLDFWEEFTLHPDEPVSTIGHAVRLSGDLDEAALLRAINRACREAEVLSLRFHSGPDGVTQSLDPSRVPQAVLSDLRSFPDPGQEAAARMAADMAARLDLARDPLSLQRLWRTGERDWLWYNRGHHIILDGYAVALFEARVAQLYRHGTGQGDPGAPFRRFGDFLDEEAAYDAGPFRARDRAHWQAQLERPGRLEVLRKGGEDYAAEGLFAEPALDPRLPDRLAGLAARMRMGWPDLLVLAASAYLHAHLPRQEEVLPVWLPNMGRLGSVAAAVPCLAVNILPLHVSVGPQETFGAFLERMGHDLRALRRHGRYRIERIAADHGLGGGQRFFFSPLVNVMPFDPPVFPGCSATREVLANGPADGFNLSFRTGARGDGLAMAMDADPKLMGLAEFRCHARDIPAFLLRCLDPAAPGMAMEALFPPGLPA
ncbi:condensation domain-containing protein [Mangrovicoccus ximenensis]|uniref:condensation domain-containing protein n=1 Tax=Mangrovicoccus ximenensis TaxID=1911570 RepID=UPI001374D307|nr:condensation domain-containing protein [Mangrovicoccus ximenensis]